ncbi:DUF6922 domain-containing protein [Gaoshiqia sediminis]|uniref:DUF6922 domain-containing protein n=1 Tax=Gaoshiqia sediminis TaxID=2986998 RepID=UPI003D0CDB73
MTQQNTLSVLDLSPHLFWDIDPRGLDIQKDFHFLVGRVLQYGLISDWLFLYKHFGLEKITAEAKQIRDLDDRSVHFIAHLSGSTLNEFKCYTWKQSIPPHWNF